MSLALSGIRGTQFEEINQLYFENRIKNFFDNQSNQKIYNSNFEIQI